MLNTREKKKKKKNKYCCRETVFSDMSWRAFLKRPRKLLGPETFRGCFRARFSGSGKRFSKRPNFSRDFRGCFREMQGIARASIFQPLIGSKIAIDTVALSWVRHVRIEFKTFSMSRPQSFISSDLYSSSNVYFLILIHFYGLLNVKTA